MNLFNWINKLMAYMTFGVTGDTGGGAVDRGDDWTPTPDEDDAPGAKDDEKGTKDDEKGAKDDDGEGADDEKGEGDEDDDEKEEKDDKKAKGKKDSRIPVKRHQEILARERAAREALERELAATRQGEKIAKTNEELAKAEEKVISLEAEYLKLLEEGKVKEAAAKMAEIRRTERSIVETNQALAVQAAEARAYERVKYDTTVERLEAAYPQINPDHEDFDKAITGEVIEMRDGYIATGKYTRAEALQKACKMLLRTSTARQEAAVTVDVRVDKEELAKATAAERKAAQVKKNLEVQGKQPPNTSGVGKDNDKAGGVLKGSDVIKMSQKDFAALSEADLKKLRGDDL